jgi:cytoplasmic iron level regulating protein YaaA (DUF328/UPF0246 family)
VLILLPASESKAEVDRGEPFDPGALSFASLAATRESVLDALIAVSGEPDALRRLGVPASLEELVRANTGLREAPSATADAVYDGALYRALGLHDLDVAARRRAREWIVAVSALWGAVRLGDRIPPYRLNMCGRLPDLGHLPQVWQEPLASVLPEAAGDGLIVDCRQAEYLTAWRPRGELADRTIALKAVRDLGTGRGAASRDSMRTQGHVIRAILIGALDPKGPDELAAALADQFDVDLQPPERDGAPWRLLVLAQR